jgi:hypothetical protein
MKWSATCQALLLLLGSIMTIHSSAASTAELDAMLSHDGLSRVELKDIDRVYTLPGASLAGYDRIALDPVEVAFRKDWDPKRSGSNLKLSQAEREKIRDAVAKLIREEFVKELELKPAYKVVTTTDAKTLKIKISIINLYITAPQSEQGGRIQTYAVSAGEMTLFMEIFDAETKQILARVVDRRRAADNTTLQISALAAREENEAAARSIASGWAKLLRSGLDRAHGITQK